MATLKKLLDVIDVSTDLSSPQELKNAYELIIEVQDMDEAERECIRESYMKGPLVDSNVPCKSARDRLLINGYMSMVILIGHDGFSACTYKGALAYRLLKAGA